MERKFYTNDFEQLLKDKTDEFRMYPSKRVWHSIYNDLHPGRKWPSIAVSMVLVIVLLMMGYWNNNDSKIAAITTGSTSNKNIANNTASVKAALAAHDIASQQNNISPIAYQNQTTIQQPFGVYKNNTQIKSASSLIADNKNVSTKQPAINWNIALGQFNNIATIITNSSSWLNNSTLFGAVEVGNKHNTHTIESTEEFGNVVALQQTENNKSLITTPANSRIKTAIAIDKKSNNKNTDAVNTDKDNSENASSIAAVNTTNKFDEASSSISTISIATNKKATADDDRTFIDNYAFYNKSKRKKWQDRTALEFYFTPSVGYRNLTSDAKYNPAPSAPFAAGMNVNASVNQKPGLGAEAGLDIIYSIAKNIRVKAGVQINYTNYSVNADETSHPVLSGLLLIDPGTGYTTLRPATTTLANTTAGSEPVKLHNKTYQISIPIGLALKLSGNNKLEWYAGATIQPTLVMGGKAYLISADRKNYVADASLIRKWNLNAGLETYISYKLDNFTLLAGPQVRYQLFSTYSKDYTVSEKLYNVGIKIGILKNF